MNRWPISQTLTKEDFRSRVRKGQGRWDECVRSEGGIFRGVNGYVSLTATNCFLFKRSYFLSHFIFLVGSAGGHSHAVTGLPALSLPVRLVESRPWEPFSNPPSTQPTSKPNGEAGRHGNTSDYRTVNESSTQFAPRRLQSCPQSCQSRGEGALTGRAPRWKEAGVVFAHS